VSNAPGMVVKKLGQPVPDSNFISEVNTGRPQPAHANTPGRFSALSGLVPARSVPSSRSTLYASGGRRFFHSSFDSLSGSLGEGTAAPAGSSVFQFFCSASMSFMVLGGAACRHNGAAASPSKNVRRSICQWYRPGPVASVARGNVVADHRAEDRAGDDDGAGVVDVLVDRLIHRLVNDRRRPMHHDVAHWRVVRPVVAMHHGRPVLHIVVLHDDVPGAVTMAPVIAVGERGAGAEHNGTCEDGENCLLQHGNLLIK